MTTATSAASRTIDQLIITSPYEEPTEHWKYDRETRRFTREPGRRSRWFGAGREYGFWREHRNTH